MSAARGCRGMIGARRFLGTVLVWSARVVVRDGVRLVCRDQGGPGEPVVLLHSLAGHAGEWGPADPDPTETRTETADTRAARARRRRRIR
ncbi:hypothetical protein GCM10017668_31440 [Streptomyces tuirus]|uniref:Uncharacterized protein n=1 Tax=Streptomyces tuirus TaxID=68278 RepID=A0A7G1NEX1_9ACTN|nr:hypothetical protein GCM10017668_31440 [Streptomyces tuirus]